MKNINWFAITIIAIWLISAVACFAAGNTPAYFKLAPYGTKTPFPPHQP